MIPWEELRQGLKNPKLYNDKTEVRQSISESDELSTDSSQVRYLGKLFNGHQYTDGWLILALAVVKQWLMDGKPVTEYAYILPWLEYIKERLPNVEVKDVWP